MWRELSELSGGGLDERPYPARRGYCLPAAQDRRAAALFAWQAVAVCGLEGHSCQGAARITTIIKAPGDWGFFLRLLRIELWRPACRVYPKLTYATPSNVLTRGIDLL